MAKRALQDADDEMITKAQFGQHRVGDDDDVEMGEFEDPWEDEIEEDEEIVEGGELVEDDEDQGTSVLRMASDDRNGRRRARARGIFAVQAHGEGPSPHAGPVDL